MLGPGRRAAEMNLEVKGGNVGTCWDSAEEGISLSQVRGRRGKVWRNGVRTIRLEA